ncbi:hypothetical protein N9980_01240 [bacterium]|nr:hypothetical protein [bacterium]
MRNINIKDALIGALATALLFIVIGAKAWGTEEITAAAQSGNEIWLFTNRGSVITFGGVRGSIYQKGMSQSIGNALQQAK